MGKWIFAVAIAAAACSPAEQRSDSGTPDDGAPGDDAPGDGPNDGAASGSRFKLIYYDFGTTRQLHTIRDTQRNEDCSPQYWLDGSTRCTPNHASFTVYSNATCTQQMGFDSTSTACPEPPPPYFVDSGTAGCNYGIAHVYPRAAKLATNQYYQLDGVGGCAGPYVGDNVDFYALGPEVPVADLGLLTPSAPSATGRLGKRFYTNPDGLKYPVRAVDDADLDIACNISMDSPGSAGGHCVPVTEANAYFYRDAACMVSQASASGVCSAPKLAGRYPGCPFVQPRFFSVGAAQTPATLYSVGTNGTCIASAPDAGLNYFAVGAEVTPAATTRVRGTGTARIQPIHHTTAEGLRVRDSYVYDSQLDAECLPQAQADGSVACLPTGNATQSYFTDAACQTPIELVRIFKGQASCATPPIPPFSITSVAATACTSNFAVRRVGAAYTGAVYQLNEATCTAVDNARHVVHRVLDIIPTSSFVSATLVTEP